VRLCIRNSVPWSEFAELTKQAFVKVARADYGLQGRPTNVARVALLTGLSRREVTRVKNLLAGRTDAGTHPGSRISQILTGWHVDPEFLDADGGPAILARAGETGSVEALLGRYAGDMPHGAVLKEMEHIGLVEPAGSGWRVTAREYVRSPADPDMLRQASVALHDHATTVVHNVDTNRETAARFERMASRRGVPEHLVAAFEKFASARAQALLEEVDGWLEDHADATGKSVAAGRTKRLGLGIYLINDDSQDGHDDE